MKWFLLLILLISCEAEDMKPFISSINTTPTTPVDPPETTTLKVFIGGQSIAEGGVGISGSGYSSAKINNPDARWLDVKGYVGISGFPLEDPTWQPFSNILNAPYNWYEQSGADATYGASQEYELGMLLQADGKKLDIVKMPKGGTVFGNDANPTTSHYISADGLTRGLITDDTVDVLTWLTAEGIQLDAVFWMHGESDAKIYAHLLTYDTMLTRWVTLMPTLTGQTNLKYFIRIMPEGARWWTELVSEGGVAGGLDIINGKLQKVIDNNANCYAVNMPANQDLADYVHPSQLGNDQMAERYKRKVDEVLYGVTLTKTTPTLDASLTYSSLGSTTVGLSITGTNIHKYKVYINGTLERVIVLPNLTNHTITKLTSGTSYAIKVIGVTIDEVETAESNTINITTT